MVSWDLAGIDFFALGHEAARRYGFSADARLTRYELTENWTFRIEDPDGREPIVLRIYRPGGKTRDEVRSELAWMRALREHGVPVPAVIRTDTDEDVLAVAAKGHPAPVLCAAFAWVRGREPPDEELRQWFPRLGEITAHMHQHAQTWTRPPWFSRLRWDVETTLGPRGHWGPWRSSVSDPEECRQLERLDDVVSARLRGFGTGPERFGLVHADLRLANLLVKGDEVTVLDFDDCGDSWYLYDLAATLTFNEGHPHVEELIASWVDAYRAVHPLSREDEREIPSFLMLRRLMLSAYVGLRNDTDLARELAEAKFSRETCDLAERYLATYPPAGE